ncbi:MAG: cytochrome P450 [Caldilineaceae bacterium]
MSENKYLLTGDAFKANPFPTFAKMRKEDPIYRVETGGYPSILWVVTNHEYSDAILRDHNRFVKQWRNTLSPEERAKLPPDPLPVQMMNNHMLNSDGSDHTRLRTLVNKAFSGNIIAQQRERVQTIANQLLDQVEAAGKMDLIDEYAFPIPIVVICDLLGIPHQDRDKFRAWSNAFLTEARSEEEWQEQVKFLQGMLDYLGAIFAQRRAQPQNDLITRLVQAEENGDHLSETELYSMVVLLIVAGHETTVNLIGNGTLALLHHPDQLAKLRANPALIESAVEELLRYDGPVETATIRFAAEDVEIGGKLIHKGEAVNVTVTSANHDESRYAHADTVDIERQNNRHLAFGMGVHYCVGAPLARMEGQIALNTLIQRLPNLQLAVPVEELQWSNTVVVRGMKHMPVVWSP